MMDAATGRLMPLAEHVRQSIRNILFTRIGTRIEREEYGSLLPLLIDAPLNEATLLQCNAAVIAAVARWEPRFTVAAAQTLADPAGGGVKIRLSGSLNGQAYQFEIAQHGN